MPNLVRGAEVGTAEAGPSGVLWMFFCRDFSLLTVSPEKHFLLDHQWCFR